jgi:hemolysin III
LSIRDKSELREELEGSKREGAVLENVGRSAAREHPEGRAQRRPDTLQRKRCQESDSVSPPRPLCRPFTEPYDRTELVLDAVMHAAGLAFALVGLIFLTSKADRLSDLQTASVWIYSVGLVTTFAMSAVYNFWPRSSAKLLLRRFDQSVIFLFIAASYTPFIVHVQTEPNRGLLAAVWIAAWIGVILKLGYPGRFDRLSIILCLALGWSGLFAYDAVFSQYPASTVCLIASGGVLYSVGVIFHLWDKLRFQNAIWHAFVVGAAALQFCAVFNSVSAAVPAGVITLHGNDRSSHLDRASIAPPLGVHVIGADRRKDNWREAPYAHKPEPPDLMSERGDL